MTRLVYLFGLLIAAKNVASAQYSNYYNVNINKQTNSNVTAKVSGTIYEQKTITTIDYGALNLANAQKEQNKIELMKFNDEKEKMIALEIASDPLKSYDYGKIHTISTRFANREELLKVRDNTGLRHFDLSYVLPSKLFDQQDNGWKLINFSPNNITTTIQLYYPKYITKTEDAINEERIEEALNEINLGVEIEQKFGVNDTRKIAYLKKEINRATVFYQSGFRSTLAWEEKYEIGITDNYLVKIPHANGIQVSVKVRYFGNKSDVDFEDIEGRRFYLKPLVDRVISLAKLSDIQIN